MKSKPDDRHHCGDRSIFEQLVQEDTRRRWAEMPKSDRLACARFMAEQKQRGRERGQIREHLLGIATSSAQPVQIGAGTNASAAPVQSGISIEAANGPSASDPVFLFRLLGDDWNIRYDGGKLFAVPDLVGLNYIHELIGKPGRQLSSVELQAVIRIRKSDPTRRGMIGALQRSQEADAEKSHGTDMGMAADREGLKKIRERLGEIELEITDAAEEGDEAQIFRLETEREEILAWLAEHTHDAKVKRLKGDSDRAHKAVKKAIDAAIDRIEQKDAACGRHLRNSIQTLRGFIYSPEREVPWET